AGKRYLNMNTEMENENEPELKKQNVYDLLTERASKIPPGSDGLIMLPHLAGAMCPEFNLKAKGVFFGITLKHDKNHFIRAIMESIGYMLRSNIDILEEMGVEITEVISTGGASKSALWNQIKSDILQKPIVTLSQQESCCLGAAILAGVGSGVFETVEEASIRMVKRMDSFVSNDNSAHAYDQAYEKYLALYDSLEKLFE
ncbi:FGGY-family carbohydrate kinase, partial [Planctomycetota bacterium]